MECPPGVSDGFRVDVWKVAVVTPPVVLSVPLPSGVAPSKKVTVPVGGWVLPACGDTALATVAVNVTFWPYGADDSGDRTVVVGAAVTVVETAFEVEGLKTGTPDALRPL